MPTESGSTATGNAQQMNDKIASVTLAVVNGVGSTLVLDQEQLKTVFNDKKARDAINEIYKDLNTPGTTFRFRAYNFYADKNGKVFTWMTKYDLLVNNKTPNRVVAENITSVPVKIPRGVVIPKGKESIRINGGIIIRGNIRLLMRDDTHPDDNLYRSGVPSLR